MELDPAIPPRLSPAEVPILRFSETESTSKYLKRLAQTGQLRGRMAVVVAERQTGATGRFNRQWSSPPGGLWFTLAWPMPSEPAACERMLDGLGVRVGVVVMLEIDRVLAQSKRPCDVRLKWPNDVLVNGRKVAGILCELTGERVSLAQHKYLLVGVGVNANVCTMQLPPELRGSACGLMDHVAEPVNNETLLRGMVSGLMGTLPLEGLPSEVGRVARERLWGVGEAMTVTLPQGQKVHGILIGLDSRGMAQIRTDEGVFTAPSGSVLMKDE